jgi:hypothetical protein
MLTTVVSSWLYVFLGDGQFLIHTGNCWAWKTQQGCRFWHKPVCLTPTTITCSKALNYFVMPIHPLNGTHTQFMSQLYPGFKKTYLTSLLHFIYTDWSEFNLRVLYTQCTLQYRFILHSITTLYYVWRSLALTWFHWLKWKSDVQLHASFGVKFAVRETLVNRKKNALVLLYERCSRREFLNCLSNIS